MSAMLISRKGVKRPTFGRMTDDPADPAPGSVKPAAALAGRSGGSWRCRGR